MVQPVTVSLFCTYLGPVRYLISRVSVHTMALLLNAALCFKISQGMVFSVVRYGEEKFLFTPFGG